MDIDFSLILLVLACIAALILLLHYLVLKPKRDTLDSQAQAPVPVWVSYAQSALPVLVVVFLFRAFLFEPFRIPSESMMPGLIPGDFIVVEKFAYDLRLPPVNWKLLTTGQPRRGDVVVFRSPSEPIILIKRLVGLPGDHIVVQDNRLSVNGQAVPLEAAGTYGEGAEFSGAPLEKEWFGSSGHLILLAPRQVVVDFDGIVPPDHYFFMGDNRNDSEDSRFSKVGFVAHDRILGRAVGIWLNWSFPHWPHWARIGKRIE